MLPSAYQKLLENELRRKTRQLAELEAAQKLTPGGVTLSVEEQKRIWELANPATIRDLQDYLMQILSPDVVFSPDVLAQLQARIEDLK